MYTGFIWHGTGSKGEYDNESGSQEAGNFVTDSESQGLCNMEWVFLKTFVWLGI